MPTTTAMPPLYFQVPSAAANAANSDPNVMKPSGFLMDASMASAATESSNMVMRDDSDAFLFYEDDVSEDSTMSDTDGEEDEDDSDEEEASDDDSGSDSDSDSSSSLDYDDAEELLKGIHSLRTGMQKFRSSNSVRSLMSNSSVLSLGLNTQTPAETVRRRMKEKSVQRAKRQEAIQRRVSISNLAEMAQQQQDKKVTTSTSGMNKMMARASISVGAHMNTMTTHTTIRAKSAQEVAVDDGAVKPDDHLASLLGGDAPQRFAHNSPVLEGFFLEPKPEYIAAWNNDITKAIREHNLTALQEMHSKGIRLQACNNFGESIVHLCVRRGTPEMLRFLLQDAGVSMRVCCDYGRTPLHDAAWCLTSNPQSYVMMALLLTESPMQLFITDKRGFTPLSYVPRARWAECNKFLDKQYAKGRFASLVKKNSNATK